MRRFLDWLALAGTAFSQALNVAVRAPLMILIGDEAPDPDETLSAVVGRRAADGASWAKALAVLIDAAMWGLDGFRWGHCARAAEAHRRVS